MCQCKGHCKRHNGACNRSEDCSIMFVGSAQAITGDVCYNCRDGFKAQADKVYDLPALRRAAVCN